jgi:putative tricarboxylic transport membrane protein
MIGHLNSLFLLFLSVGMAYLSSKLSLGSFKSPGPGLYPLLVALILTFLSTLLLISSWFAGRRAAEKNEQMAIKKVGFILGVLLIYAVSLQWLGFLLSTFLFFLLPKPAVEKKWSFVVIGSLLAALASYFFFCILLKCVLPEGILRI